MTDQEKLIIKALKKGVPLRRIAQELGVTERTMSRWILKNPKFKEAKELYLTFIDNMFNT